MSAQELNHAAQVWFDAQCERALNYEQEPLEEYDPYERAEAQWEAINGR